MRPANFAKSASFSMSALALRMMVFLRSFSEISEPTERRSSRSISASGMSMSKPIMAKEIRFLSSVPSQKDDWPSSVVTVTMNSWLGSSAFASISSRRRERWAR